MTPDTTRCSAPSGRPDAVDSARLRLTLLVLPALSVLAVTLSTVPASAQTSPSVATLTVRHGWEVAGGRDGARGIGFEVEVRPHGAVVPFARYDRWDFGIACVGLVPCPSGVTLVSVGGTVRGRGSGRVVPFAGADVGRMRWTSGAKGGSLRFRSGMDVRLARFVGLTFDLGYTRFVQESAGPGRMLQDGHLGMSGGVRVAY